MRDVVLHAAARRAHCKTVVQLHGWSAELARAVDRSSASRALLRRTLLRADAVLTVTQGQRRHLLRWGVAPDRVQVVSNPHEVHALPPRPCRRPTVLYLGRLVPAKRPSLLLEAFSAVVASGVPARLEIGGDGPSLPDLVQQVRRLGLSDRVAFLGWVGGASKQAALQRATVLALPSAEEASPLAVLDALAAGVPVVASHVGALPDLVRGSGRLIAPDAAAAAWAVALREMLADPPRVQADLSRSAPDAVARSWCAVYDRVLSAP